MNYLMFSKDHKLLSEFCNSLWKSLEYSMRVVSVMIKKRLLSSSYGIFVSSFCGIIKIKGILELFYSTYVLYC